LHLVSGHKNIETLILNTLSSSSVDMFETTVEAFLLSKRDLFDSTDYSRVILPVQTLHSMEEMVELVNLIFLLKKMYGSKVYLAINIALKKKNKNLYFLHMFTHLFDGPFFYRKLWELYEFCDAMNITKAVYHKAFSEYKAIAPSVTGCISTKTSLDWMPLLPPQMKRNVSNIIHVQQYKKINGTNTVLDYIVPFLGVNLYDRFSFFKKPVFEYSIASKRGLIK